MSQQHGFSSHPPPPPATASSRGDTVPHFVQQRRQPGPAQPPSITTNFLRTQGVGSQTQTPASALTPGHSAWPYSPATPSVAPSRSSSAGYSDASRLLSPSRAHLQSPGSPSMAQQPYNPRQWSGHGSHLAYAPQSSPLSRAAAEVTGMEAAMPSPPPPYSPETHNIAGASQTARPSPVVEQISFASSPLAAESADLIMPSTTIARHSPQHPRSPAFPPPPPGQFSRTRERSASGQRLLNTIHSLTGRGKQPASHDLPASHSAHYPSGSENFRAPAARRAVSTGHVFPATASSSSSPHRAIALNNSGRTSPEGSSWHPGMPLPGPPPGPPPPGTRSQSLNRFPTTIANSSTTPGNDFRHPSSANSDHNAPTPLQRRAAAQASTLGPVPPTPADWNDADDLETAIRSIEEAHGSNVSSYQPLRINTGTRGESSTSHGGRNSRRDASADGNGIRERRSKSRAARELESASTCSSNVMSPASDNVRPKDFVSSSTLQSSISQRRENMRKISGYASVSAIPPDPSSVHTTTRSAKDTESVPHATSILTPPYTPAVGNQGVENSQRRVLAGPLSASSDKSVSRLLHASNEETATMPATSSSSRPSPSVSKLDMFYQQAIERHHSLIQRESAAMSDEERLEIFASFLVHESRLRRDRYQSAYNNMAGDVMDLTRDMWRSYNNDGKRAITPSTSMSSMDPTIPSWASDGGLTSAQGVMPSSASSIGEFTPATDTASFGDSAEMLDRPDSRQWGEQFKPSLSPIPSMAVSTVPDEDSSRGRTASRWWEQSDTGSIGHPDRMEKSHRETKYMGVTPASLRDGHPQPSPEAMRSSPSAGGLTNFVLGPDEYPAEKTGWHEQSEFNTPMATPFRPGDSRKSSNASAHVDQLDVSRLVTLPPPYPRHHPAVNNSHPQLSELRNAHRQLASQMEIQQIRDAYLDRDWALQRSHQEEAKKRRTRLRNSIQEKLNAGSISFADAARAETTFESSEAENARLAARATFDAYEQSISHPLNALLTSRLASAEASISALLADLSPSTTPNPNQAQEEGDEHPERLEKLTLLKWLFEAREQLHKEMADLHAQRADKFAPVILTPYRLHQPHPLTAKIAEAQAFFAQDRASRAATYAREALSRITTLQEIVELNVARGVEDQLSAFWDIAPGLLEIINAVPASDRAALSLLRVSIPLEEYDENPALSRWPLQYLYSLLAHAGKSARQFIEAQVNLLCLLHEVRGAKARAEVKVERCERSEPCQWSQPNQREGSELNQRAGGELNQQQQQSSEPNPRETGAAEIREAELEAEIARAESRLDGDLKEKVGEVERQWKEALGDGLELCKDGVRACLIEDGGWVEGLED